MGWFLDGGLTRFRRSRSSPSVRLHEVKIGDQALNPVSSVSEISTGQHVTIQYREVDLKTHPEKRQFWYRLAKASGETVFAGVTKERSFDWSPSQDGTYRFEVQAIDRDLNYSDPARLTFRATVPWHANAWITVPGGAAMAGLLVWVFVARGLYLRKRREAERLRERARIARDLHDNLGAGLTHVGLLSNFVRSQAGESGDGQAHLAKQLDQSVRELSQTMAEVVWSADPDKDTLSSFVSFVSVHAEKFFAGSAIRLRLDFPRQLPAVLLPAELRHGLYLVVKEALNNVAKYAQATEVRIKLECEDRELLLIIEDNGRGLERSQVASECYGLANMEKRMRDLGGQLQVDSGPGKGTRIEARAPLPKK